MKAVYITEHGGSEKLTYGDLPDPRVGPNDVLVRVRCCALNRLDVFVRLGVRGSRLALDEPHVLGSDVAGDVLETGSEVSRVRPGDRVVVNPKITCRECGYCLAAEDELCVSPDMMGRTTRGGYSELVSVPAVNVVPIPDTLSYEQAAALPTVFMPVWSMLLRRAKLRAWETALVLSASSGVGTAAIQVAKRVVGATVVATTSTDEKAQMAAALGADHVIQYTSEDVRGRLKELTGGRGVDVVVDHVGAEPWADAFPSLAPGGRYGICGVTSGYKAELHMGQLFLMNQTVFGVFMGRKDDLRQIVEMASRGTIRGVVDRTFSLEDAASAHDALEGRQVFGKVVLTVP